MSRLLQTLPVNSSCSGYEGNSEATSWFGNVCWFYGFTATSPAAYSAHTSKLLNATQAALSRNLSAVASAQKNAKTPTKKETRSLWKTVYVIFFFKKRTWGKIFGTPNFDRGFLKTCILNFIISIIYNILFLYIILKLFFCSTR